MKIEIEKKDKVKAVVFFAVALLAVAVYFGEVWQPYSLVSDVKGYVVNRTSHDTVQPAVYKQPPYIARIYVVKEDDTVSSIARKHKVHVRTLMFANNLGEDALIKPGQILNIPQG